MNRVEIDVQEAAADLERLLDRVVPNSITGAELYISAEMYS